MNSKQLSVECERQKGRIIRFWIEYEDEYGEKYLSPVTNDDVREILRDIEHHEEIETEMCKSYVEQGC